MFNAIGNCSCYDFVDTNGYGNCEKGHINKNNLTVCYVHQPTNCPDVLDSSAFPGRQISSYACRLQ